MINNLGSVEFVGTDNAGIPVLCLVSSLSFIVTFPMKLTPGYIDQLIEIETFGEDAKHIDQQFEVVKI